MWKGEGLTGIVVHCVCVLAVTAKIRSLYDCQLRLMHNIQPLPSGTDIANTVKYFSQTLLSEFHQYQSIIYLFTN
jgi:hypothetical protein